MMDFKKNKWVMDVLLIGAVLILAAGAAGIVYFTHGRGDVVVVKVDGEVVREIKLTENEEFSIEGYQGGSNIVVVQDGTAYVKEADCPDELCVKTGKITRVGETVVCLPHRVVVEIIGDSTDADGIDSVVK